MQYVYIVCGIYSKLIHTLVGLEAYVNSLARWLVWLSLWLVPVMFPDGIPQIPFSIEIAARVAST